MAANPSIVQSSASASAAAAPANFTANFGQATQAGTLLVAIVVAAMSAAGSISTPAGWSQGTSNSNAAINGKVLFQLNNPGGITSVVFSTLTNVNGIAVALFEISTMALISARDTSMDAANISAGATSYNTSAKAVTIGNEFIIGAIANLATQTPTPANVPAGAGYWGAGPTATSTNGATNVQLSTFTAQPGPVPPPSVNGAMQIAGTLSGSVAWLALLSAFISQNSGALIGAGTGMGGGDMLTGQALSVGSA